MAMDSNRLAQGVLTDHVSAGHIVPIDMTCFPLSSKSYITILLLDVSFSQLCGGERMGKGGSKESALYR